MKQQGVIYLKYSYPIRISDNKRYFVDSEGTPFFWHGDTCWKLFWEFTDDEAKTYLENRAEIGFNVIQVHLLPHRFFQCNRNGDRPFLKKGEITALNEAYFAHVDRIIEMGAELGLAFVMSPMWLSGWEQQWHTVFNTETAPIFARIVAERLKKHKNIIAWIQGGDTDAPHLRDAVDLSAKVFREVTPDRLQTYHAWTKGGWQFFPDAEWLDFCMAYSYSTDYLVEQIFDARSLGKPVVLGETHYEGNEDITAEDIRRYAYTATLCGLAGQTYGHKDVWMYTYFWTDALGSACSRHMTILKEFVDSIRWWELEPVDDMFKLQENPLRVMPTDLQRESFFPAACNKEKTFAVVYFTNNREFFPDEHWLSDRFERYWIDPVSARKYPFKTPTWGGYRTPNTNAGGGQDWILVIEEKA